MLTDMTLDAIEELSKKMGGAGISTVKELISEIRTLQQQNKELREEMSDAREANRIVAELHDKFQQQNKQLVEGLVTMAESSDEWYVSRTPMREYAKYILEKLQGGSSSNN